MHTCLVATSYHHSCESLRSLPSSFGSLSSLKSLHLRRCRQLTSVPASFASLAGLQTLDMTVCYCTISTAQADGRPPASIMCSCLDWQQAEGQEASAFCHPRTWPISSKAHKALSACSGRFHFLSLHFLWVREQQHRWLDDL